MLLILGLLSYLDRSTLSIANTVIAENFNISPAKMGILLSAFMWPYAIASLPSGYLVDKFGINKIMIVSIAGWSIASIFGGLVIGFYSILFTRILLGMVEAPFFIIATKIIQQYFKPSQRGLASSIVALGPRLANVIAPIFLVSLIAIVSWRGMFILLGIFGSVMGAIWYITTSSSLKKVLTQSTTENNVSLINCIKDRNVALLCVGNLGSSYAYWVFLTWLPYYFIHNKGLDLKQMGIATSLSFILSIISVMLGGIVSDALIKRKTCAVKARLTPIILGCTIAGFAIVALPFIADLKLSIVIISISVFCLGFRISPTWALVADISSKETVGSTGGIQNFSNFVGAGLAPLLTGFILSATDSFTLVFLFSGIVCLSASVCYVFIKDTSKNLN